MSSKQLFLDGVVISAHRLSEMVVSDAREVFDVPEIEVRRMFDGTSSRITHLDAAEFLRYCELILEHNK